MGHELRAVNFEFRRVKSLSKKQSTTSNEQPASARRLQRGRRATSNGLYYSFNEYCRDRFGGRVERLAIDAGFSCPNRISRMEGGCVYCGPRGSRAPYVDFQQSVSEQLTKRISELKPRPAVKYAPYFQAYSNTCAPVSKLRRLYQEALSVSGTVMLIVGTRPDCLEQATLDLLAELNERVEVWLELGLQSAQDQTLKRIKRGHDFACFSRAVRAAHRRKLKVAAHVIIGLPGEGRREVMMTAESLAALPLDGIKIHSLHVVSGSALAADLLAGRIKLLGRDEYVRLTCDFLERLPVNMVVGRVTGEAPREILIAPQWCLDKMSVLKAIDEEFAKRGTRQGSKHRS